MVAVLFRQTNVVWVVFTAGVVASNLVADHIHLDKKDVSAEVQRGPRFLKVVIQHLWRGLKERKSGDTMVWYNLISTLLPYGGVCVAFVTFVFANNGIVVGAKDDHQVSANFPQLFYFASFTGFFSVFHMLTPQRVLRFLKFLYNRPIVVMLFVAISTVLIWKFTCEHRYLLADNRHYTFYVWHRVYKRHEYVKFALIPGYLFAWWSIWDQLHQQNFLWKLIFFVCVVVNLVPQMLLEFRYFIVPYLMFRLHSQFTTHVQVVLELGLYLLVNTATMYLFMEKPFTWPNEPGLQRFLW